MKKKYLKSKAICKVNFSLPKQATESAETVFVAGDFNGWDSNATPLKKQKNGGFSTTVDLETGKEYQFRYLINQTNWENDWDADKYVPSGIAGTENSVVVA